MKVALPNTKGRSSTFKLSISVIIHFGESTFDLRCNLYIIKYTPLLVSVQWLLPALHIHLLSVFWVPTMLALSHYTLKLTENQWSWKSPICMSLVTVFKSFNSFCFFFLIGFHFFLDDCEFCVYYEWKFFKCNILIN